jgi:hypothetical protein
MAFHGRRQRWAILVAHRRAGKTVTCVADLTYAAMACTKPEGRFAYVAPQYNQAKDIAWLYVKRLTSDIPGVEYNESELRADLPNGARVRLYGADNPNRLRGIYFDGVIMDEHADMRPSVWGEIVRPMLSDRRGWAAFIGTPRGHNGFYQLWRSAERDEGWYSLMLRGSESGLVSADELADMRKTMADELYAQEVECSFDAAILGSILGQYIERAEREGRINPDVDYDRDGAPLIVSSDIGFHDTAAWWFWQPKMGGYSLVDYDDDSGLDAQDWIDRLEARLAGKNLAKIWLPHDARAKTFQSRHTVVEQFLARWPGRIGVVPVASKQDRINAARMVIGRCEFNMDKCRDGIEGLRHWQFGFNEETKQFSREPKHDWASHPSDAFSYGAQVMRMAEPARKPAPDVRGPLTIGEMIKYSERPTTGRVRI